MSTYVDGFVFTMPRKNLETYKKMAQLACTVWKEYGALEYRECVGDDMNTEHGLPFPQLTDLGQDDVVIFSYITFKSREHRDEVNQKVMADPRMSQMCSQDEMPFDVSKMAYGGFQTLVSTDE